MVENRYVYVYVIYIQLSSSMYVYCRPHVLQRYINPRSRENLTTLSASPEVALIHFGCAVFPRKHEDPTTVS